MSILQYLSFLGGRVWRHSWSLLRLLIHCSVGLGCLSQDRFSQDQLQIVEVVVVVEIEEVVEVVCHQGWAGMTFGHLGTGTGLAQPIPKLWEREWEWKILFPTFGNGNGKIWFPIFGNGNGNSITAFWEREWDIVIPGNDREWGRELHRKIEWKFFIIPLFNPINILHCNRPLSLSHLTFHSTGQVSNLYLIV